MENNRKIRRNLMDSLFRDMYGNREMALAFFKSVYPDIDVTKDDIEIRETSAVLVKTVKSDLVFRVKDQFIFLVEAQTTWSENLATRAFKYISNEFDAFFNALENGTDALLKYKRVKIPTPQAWIIYTGPSSDEIPEVVKLSDSYYHPMVGMQLECTVPVMKDKNHLAVFDAYFKFYEKYTGYKDEGKTPVEAAEKACRWCIANGYMVEYFKEHIWEVVQMMSTEEGLLAAERSYYEDELKEAEAKGEARGEARGEAKGEAKIIRSLLTSGFTVEKISEILKMDTSEIEKMLRIDIDN